MSDSLRVAPRGPGTGAPQLLAGIVTTVRALVFSRFAPANHLVNLLLLPTADLYFRRPRQAWRRRMVEGTAGGADGAGWKSHRPSHARDLDDLRIIDRFVTGRL